MKNQIRFILFFVVFFFLIFCGQPKVEWKGTIVEEDGVMVVNNPSEPIYGPEVFNLEEDLTIENDEGKEEFMFQNILNLAVDDEENIYVCDVKASQIRVFDKNGDYVRTIGKKGQGPGEMSYPIDIKALPEGVLIVNDSNQLRLNYFSMNGEHLRTLSTSQLAVFRRPAVDSQGNIVAGFVILGDKLMYELTKFDPDLNPVFTITTHPLLSRPPTLLHYFEISRTTNLVWNVNEEDHIIWGLMTKYELFVHNPEGKLIMKIIRDYDGVKITNQEKEKLIKSYFGDSPLPPNLNLKFPDRYPPFIRFCCDEEGRIIVQTYDKTEDGEADYYDVFDSEGKYIARFSLKYTAIIWKKHKLYTIEEDEDGFQVVKRYHVTWKI